MLNSRRSVLAVPASSRKMVEKALNLQVDQVFLDLEDAVAPEAKNEARELIQKTFDWLAVENKRFTAGAVSIRVNGSETSWLGDDLDLLAGGVGKCIDSIILPKVGTIEEIKWFSNELSKVESDCGIKEGSISIDVQIETAKGLVNVESIAHGPRVSSIAFGPVDFMADLGMPPSDESSQAASSETSDMFNYPLMKILVAARAAGVKAIDGPILDVHDIEKFRISAIRAQSMGFDGKWVLHPSQIATCNEIFTPTQDAFDFACMLIQAYEFYTGTSGGEKGAVIYEGVMIDEASCKLAKGVQARGFSGGLLPRKVFNG